MQTDLSPQLLNQADGLEAQRLLSNCVHCGFCTATCPTYQLLGDELDGPRGRIYLIKQMAEGAVATEKTRTHLDRCLTCRNCESTCPSGVQYGHLLDIGRKWAESQTPPRPIQERVIRWLLKETLTRKSVFEPAMKIGKAVKPILPISLQRKIPDSIFSGPKVSSKENSSNQKMILLEGCVQPGMLPNINEATLRVFHFLNIDLISPKSAGCCGALRHHLNDHEGGKNDIKRNIDAWWPVIEANEVSAIVMNASGCGVMVKDYGYLLKDDAEYSEKAKYISSITKDVSELLLNFSEQFVSKLGKVEKSNLVYHPPCTLQHGQKLQGKVEALLTQIGIQVNLCNDSHLCCGSAGTYSILQEKLSNELRAQKLSNPLHTCNENQSEYIVSGNVGCISQLQNEKVPVVHWIEIIDQLLLKSN